MSKKDKTRISITVTKPYIEAMNNLIESGIYFTRGEIVLEALRHFFKDWGIELPYHNESEE